MQTFLPFSSFDQSARVLDRLRLGKQRVEVYQILRTLSGEKDGWKNHPVVRMWEGHKGSLVEYGLAICNEWVDRGYNDNCRKKILKYKCDPSEPGWLGDENLHQNYRHALVIKDPDHYQQYFDVSADNLPSWEEFNYNYPV